MTMFSEKVFNTRFTRLPLALITAALLLVGCAFQRRQHHPNRYTPPSRRV